MKLEFSQNIFEKYETSIFMRIHPVGDELFHADRWTEITKLIATFHNFSHVPKNTSFKN